MAKQGDFPYGAPPRSVVGWCASAAIATALLILDAASPGRACTTGFAVVVLVLVVFSVLSRRRPDSLLANVYRPVMLFLTIVAKVLGRVASVFLRT